jgi:hypothetical protein
MEVTEEREARVETAEMEALEVPVRWEVLEEAEDLGETAEMEETVEPEH